MILHGPIKGANFFLRILAGPIRCAEIDPLSCRTAFTHFELDFFLTKNKSV